MTAAISSLELEQLQIYGLAFYFSSKAATAAIIDGKGIPTIESDGRDCVPVWTIRPVNFGWDVGGETWRDNVGLCVYGEQWDPAGKHAEDIRVMLVLRVPKHVLAAARLGFGVSGRVFLTDDLLRDAPPSAGATRAVDTGTEVARKVYPSAHILKCYGTTKETPQTEDPAPLQTTNEVPVSIDSRVVAKKIRPPPLPSPSKKPPPALPALVHFANKKPPPKLPTEVSM
jgi:hypothetical protein